ncbi:MAG: alpha/beta fold hydrolase [Acidimicrobiales bacterium]
MSTSRGFLADGDLAYHRWGNKPGPAVVLLHSLGEDSGTWRRVAPELARRRSVHALDLRGHGASRHTPLYSLELMKTDVLGAIDELDLDDTCLVGHSLGGMVAYLAAAEQPETIGRLVLEESPPPVPAMPRRELAEEPNLALSFDWAAVEAIYAERNAPDPGWWDNLASISVPTLLIGGGATSHVDQRQLEQMAEQIADCQLLTIEAGHNVHANQPEAFVEAVEGFLADW